MGDAGWEREAENWIRWARTPGHDAYWYYRDAFFDAIVPHGGGRALEGGCGEGRGGSPATSAPTATESLDSTPLPRWCGRRERLTRWAATWLETPWNCPSL